VFDSTGLKVYGEGKWKVRKHGISKRRTWRKLHVNVDEKTGLIHAQVLTENGTGDADSQQFPELLEQVGKSGGSGKWRWRIRYVGNMVITQGEGNTERHPPTGERRLLAG
jgi:hypothetical protein